MRAVLDAILHHALLAPLVGVGDIVLPEIHEGPAPLEGQRPSLGNVALLDAGADHVGDRGVPGHRGQRPCTALALASMILRIAPIIS